MPILNLEEQMAICSFLHKAYISNPLDVCLSVSIHTLTLTKSSSASSHLLFHLSSDNFLSSAFRIKIPDKDASVVWPF